MGTDTAARPRAGFLHRLQCARDGHYWERQLSDDGGQARWVCIRCGKQGERVPLVSAVTPIDEVVRDVVGEAGPAPVTSFTEPEWEPAAEPITLAAPEPEPSATSPGPSLVAIAAVSLLVVGGVYLAFRRRRR